MKQATKDYWLEHIEQWQASSLSQAAYCRRHNIKAHLFSYYKCRLEQEGQSSTASASGFARAVSSAEACSRTLSPLSIKLPNGITIPVAFEN